MKKRAKESPLKKKIIVRRDEAINPDFPYIVAANGYEFDDAAVLGGLRAPGKTNTLRDALAAAEEYSDRVVQWLDDDSPYRPG